MEVGASACMKEAEFQMQRQQWPTLTSSFCFFPSLPPTHAGS